LSYLDPYTTSANRASFFQIPIISWLLWAEYLWIRK
jgi:hypothetical protein